MDTIITPIFILGPFVRQGTALCPKNYLQSSLIASAFQAFQLGSGRPTEVAVWTRSFPMPTRKTSHTVLNKAGRKAWREDGPTKGQCLWEMHGIWGWDKNKDEAVVLRENYFVKHPMSGKKVCHPSFQISVGLH